MKPEHTRAYPAIVFSVVLVITAGVLFFIRLKGDDISISISDTKDELVLSASFPREDSKLVHNYVKTQLHLDDLSDFSYLEVKHYHAPDKRMQFYIKSRDGYIKIALNKSKNSLASYHKLKRTGEGLKEILSHR